MHVHGNRETCTSREGPPARDSVRRRLARWETPPTSRRGRCARWEKRIWSSPRTPARPGGCCEAHGLDRPLRSCFDANEAERAGELADLLRAGKNVALVSEAGTPAVSDPGFRLIRAAIDAGARVVPVPGPSALLAALVASGLPTDRFLFLGFPPAQAGRPPERLPRRSPRCRPR